MHTLFFSFINKKIRLKQQISLNMTTSYIYFTRNNIIHSLIYNIVTMHELMLLVADMIISIKYLINDSVLFTRIKTKQQYLLKKKNKLINNNK